MKEMLTVFQTNLSILSVRISNIRLSWDGYEHKAEADTKLKKINDLLYEISDVLEQMESEMEL